MPAALQPTERVRRGLVRAGGSVEDVLARQPWELLRAPLRGAGVDVGVALERLRRYARLLLEWNRSVSNIMSKNDEDRIVERHLLESVAPARWLAVARCARWLDFGSGAGFPAIPLALAGVVGSWTLVESRRTKTLFIRKTIQDIKLDDFTTVNDRLENIAADPDRIGTFDGFTSRATMRLGPTLALASRIVSSGGSAFLWKGSGRGDEMDKDPRWRDAWEFTGILGVGSGLNVVARFVRKSIN